MGESREDQMRALVHRATTQFTNHCAHDYDEECIKPARHLSQLRQRATRYLLLSACLVLTIPLNIHQSTCAPSPLPVPRNDTITNNNNNNNNQRDNDSPAAPSTGLTKTSTINSLPTEPANFGSNENGNEMVAIHVDAGGQRTESDLIDAAKRHHETGVSAAANSSATPTPTRTQTPSKTPTRTSVATHIPSLADSVGNSRILMQNQRHDDYVANVAAAVTCLPAGLRQPPKSAPTSAPTATGNAKSSEPKNSDQSVADNSNNSVYYYSDCDKQQQQHNHHNHQLQQSLDNVAGDQANRTDNHKPPDGDQRQKQKQNNATDSSHQQQQHQQPAPSKDDVHEQSIELELAQYQDDVSNFIFEEFYRKNLSDFMSAAGATSGGSQFGRSSSAFPMASPDGSGGYLADGRPANGTGVNASEAISDFGSPLTPRPYFGDAFITFQKVIWPIHCVVCLVICTLGTFANVTNIIVLTRPNMITAVNAILCAMAFSDLLVNIVHIPYLVHESGDSNLPSHNSYPWALYVLFHAHITVTAHTISVWLTCVLATWRYFVVCRSSSANQRTWSVGLAKKAIVAVALIVPISCIPSYLSFGINKEFTDTNATIYKVGFSSLADQSSFTKTFTFSAYSCLSKLVPCILLSYFTTVLIRKLMSARERRLRLTSHSGTRPRESEGATRDSLPNGRGPERRQNRCSLDGDLEGRTINDAEQLGQINPIQGEFNANGGHPNADHDEDGAACRVICGRKSSTKAKRHCTTEANGRVVSKQDRNLQLLHPDTEVKMINDRTPAQQSASSCATDAELLGNSCNSSSSGGELNTHQQPRILSQLIVSTADTANNFTVTTSTAPTKMLTAKQVPEENSTIDGNTLDPNFHLESPRAASTCGALETYDGSSDLAGNSPATVQTSIKLVQPKGVSVHDLSRFDEGRRSLCGSQGAASAINLSSVENPRLADKRPSEATLATRGRSVGSTSLAPLQMIKLQASQRQLNQNETTTRLLIAVMIVFLICEFPAGIMVALCAILGQDFFENVYLPTGMVTDLLALINSSVNFILYCFMSTQFRITFYRVVLRCPAPNMPPSNHAG